MDFIDNAMKTLKKSFINILLPYTDKSYFILRHKQDPNEQQLKYMQLYQASLFMHTVSIALMIPATFRYFKYKKFMGTAIETTSQSYQKTKAKMFKKVVIPASLCFALTTVTMVRQFQQDFYTKTKQIQNRYAQLIADLQQKKKITKQIKKQQEIKKQQSKK